MEFEAGALYLNQFGKAPFKLNFESIQKKAKGH